MQSKKQTEREYEITSQTPGLASLIEIQLIIDRAAECQHSKSVIAFVSTREALNLNLFFHEVVQHFNRCFGSLCVVERSWYNSHLAVRE
jgi:hypothetical protein